MSDFRLYLRYVSMTIQSQMAYKASFIMMTAGNFFLQFIEFVGLYALFGRFGAIKGWTIYEVSLFYGVIHMAFAIAECIGRGYDTFHIQVRTGTFDRLLLRPRPLPMQILGSEFQMMRIGRFIQGFLVLIYGLLHIEMKIGVLGIFLIVVAIFGGVCVFLGLFVLQATMSFFTIQSLEVMNAFTYGGVQMAQYPITIYKKWFQKMFIFILPLGAVSFYPLSGILRHGSLVYAYMAPVLGVLFFGVTLIIFNLGTKYYCSTGS